MSKRPTQRPLEFQFQTFTQKQKAALGLALSADKKYVMLSGGQRSGKSTVASSAVSLRALSAANSKHLIAHAYANVCYRNLWRKTFPETLEILLPTWYSQLKSIRQNGSPVHVRESDRMIVFPNGSEIHFWGLDDSEKLRGSGFSTIFINEANSVTYETFMTAAGRLSERPLCEDGSILQPKMLIDLNPTSKASWEYQLFVEGLVPDQRTPLPNPEKYAWLRINPSSNIANLPPDYMEDVFGGMTEQQRLRDEHGEWAEDNPDALFNLADIQRGEIDLDSLVEVVVAVDPAVTSKATSDRTGIIVAGRCPEGRYYILEDATMRAKPEEWAKRVLDLYDKYSANKIVAETNQGGDLIATMFRLIDPSKNVPIKGEFAASNKRGRAERVSVLYQQHKVYHTTVFRELEQELISFDAPTFRGSPDHVDALVYALSALSGIRTSGPIRQQKIAGFLG